MIKLLVWGVARPRKSPPFPLESALRAAAEVLYRELDQPNEQLQAWAERSGLLNGKADLRRVLAQQAALELLLLMVYEALPADATANLPIREVAAQLPYSDLLSRTRAREVMEAPDMLLQRLDMTLAGDLLGQLYEVLTPQAERRTLGQYWTPEPIVQFMTTWALAAGPRILEPAIGSGRFLQEIERQYADDPAAPPAYVRGYEVSPLVMMVALVNAALRRTQNVQLDLRLESYLDSTDADTGFDGVVCNPPYTRHHHITPEQKVALAASVERKFGVRLSGFTSLFVHFLLHALTQVRPGGRLAYITPAELYEASYGEPVKAILRRVAQPSAIIVFDQSHQVFEGVDTAGCITLAQHGGTEDGHTLLVEVHRWPGTEVMMNAVTERQVGQYDWGTVTLLDAAALTPQAKWSNPRQMTTRAEDQDVGHLPTLGTLAKVMRGVATGANDYFCLSTAEVAATGIPWEFFQPVITKTRIAKSFQLTKADLDVLEAEGNKVWLFTSYQDREDMPPAVFDYIKHGEDLGLHERSLLKLKKRKWYMVERRPAPPILFTYLSRAGTRFIYNAAGAQALNVFLLVYPHQEIARDPQLVKALTAILNADPIRRGLHAVGRSYGSDTVKLEPRELDLLPILDPRRLPGEVIQQLVTLLDQLNDDEDGQAQLVLDNVVTDLIQGQTQTALQRTRQAMQPILF